MNKHSYQVLSFLVLYLAEDRLTLFRDPGVKLRSSGSSAGGTSSGAFSLGEEPALIKLAYSSAASRDKKAHLLLVFVDLLAFSGHPTLGAFCACSALPHQRLHRLRRPPPCAPYALPFLPSPASFSAARGNLLPPTAFGVFCIPLRTLCAALSPPLTSPSAA